MFGMWASMQTLKSIFRVIGAVALVGCVILLADCAGRKGGKPSGDSIDSGSKQSQGSHREGITLPGQNRTLPSEDPQNQPREGRQTKISTLVRPVYERPAEVAPDNPFPPPPLPAGARRYRVQVLASTFLKNALRMREELVPSFGEAVYLEVEREIWKVRVGDEARRSEAQSLRRRLIGLGYEDAFIVESNGR